MRNSKTRLWTLGGIAAGVFAVMALVIAFGGSSATPAAHAAGTPLTATPTPTAAKPNGLGALTGVVDIWVPSGVYPTSDKNTGLFHCISYNSHDSITNVIKSSSQCVADTQIGDTNSELSGINVPGEGTDGRPGPPPPPPYMTGSPAKGLGSYNPGTDHVTLTSCFTNIGGSLGPNIIAVVNINNAVAQLTSTGKQGGSLKIYGGQSNAQCRSLTPTGAEYPFATATLNIKLHPISNADCSCTNLVSPWRTDEDLDYDNDGCTDRQELSKGAAHPATCGDDPWNPNDSGAATNDLSGGMYILATGRAADACQGGTWDHQADTPQLYNCAGPDNNPVTTGDNSPDRTFVPGAYYHCYTYITDSAPTGDGAVAADILCYIDFGPNTNTHPTVGDAPGPGTPLSVNPEQCTAFPPKAFNCTGDGKSGAAPPGETGWGVRLFADIDTKHSHLTGSTAGGILHLEGCFPDLDTRGPLGWVYVKADLNQYTLEGVVSVYSFQVQNDCETGSPLGTPQKLSVEAAKQSSDPLRDTDQDGCPDAMELTDDATTGGLRDPSNPWDYFNPANNAINRTGDITAVVQHYGHDDNGDPLYGKKYDRQGQIPGSNKWNLRPPDGQIRTADITAAVNSYGQDCGTAINKTPTPTVPPNVGTPPKVSP